MGEYAKYNGERVKIGTCESMYYLRYDDRFKVVKEDGNVDPAREQDLFWRLPFPDEDYISIGNYEVYNRSVKLYTTDKETGRTEYFKDETLVEDPGTIQLTHPCGLLLNVPCYHGFKLPDNTGDIHCHWNGKTPSFIELCFVKNDSKRGVVPVVRCIYCGKMWSYDMHEVLPFVNPFELRQRLERYVIKSDDNK